MDEQHAIEVGIQVSDILVWAWVAVVGALGWFIRRQIAIGDERFKNLEAQVDEMDSEQDNTMLLKEIGRNEGGLTKLHERMDAGMERIIKLEAQVEALRSRTGRT